MIDPARLITANAALQCFAPRVSLADDRGYVRVTWTGADRPTSRRWMTRGQDFYPVFNRQLPLGGTCTTALSQLVRWCGDKPVLPLSTWKYWTGEVVRMARHRPGAAAELVELLETAGYPAVALCVLCQRPLESLDWWSLKGVSGPCCSYHDAHGCRQTPR